MLYDKRWDKQFETRVNPLSLEGLISWLQTMPAHQFYNFYCAGECMVGQWVQSIDEKAKPAQSEGWGSDYYVVNGAVVELSRFVRIANSGEENGFTFGAALDRARAALSVTSKER